MQAFDQKAHDAAEAGVGLGGGGALFAFVTFERQIGKVKCLDLFERRLRERFMPCYKVRHTTSLPRHCYVTATSLPRHCHVTATSLPRHCHVTATSLPLTRH